MSQDTHRECLKSYPGSAVCVSQHGRATIFSAFVASASSHRLENKFKFQFSTCTSWEKWITLTIISLWSRKSKIDAKSITRFFWVGKWQIGRHKWVRCDSLVSVTGAHASKMASISEILSRATRVRECVMITGRGRWFYIFSENAPRPRLWPGVAWWVRNEVVIIIKGGSSKKPVNALRHSRPSSARRRAIAELEIFLRAPTCICHPPDTAATHTHF